MALGDRWLRPPGQICKHSPVHACRCKRIWWQKIHERHPKHKNEKQRLHVDTIDTIACTNFNPQVCWRIVMTIYLWCGTNKANSVAGSVLNDVADSIAV